MSLSQPLGAILAGGESRRYGAPKALATIGGMTFVERVRRALLSSTSGIVLLASDPQFRGAGLPLRADLHPGLGPISGIQAALLAAEERGAPGAMILACDLPLVPAALVQEIVERFIASGGGRVVVPLSAGRHGMEPLCACYPVGALAEVTRRIDGAVAARRPPTAKGDSSAATMKGRSGRDALSVIALVRDLHPITLSLEDVSRIVKPSVAFLNVNRPGDREEAERWLEGEGEEGPRSIGR